MANKNNRADVKRLSQRLDPSDDYVLLHYKRESSNVADGALFFRIEQPEKMVEAFVQMATNIPQFGVVLQKASERLNEKEDNAPQN